MKTNRIIVALLTATVLMQGAIMYKQYANQGNRGQNPQGQVSVRSAPSGSTIDIKDLPVQGVANAKVVLVEFSDYECPFCKRHANTVGKQLYDKFVVTGQVQHVFVNNPLPIHPNAKHLAAAAICAGEQEAYWKMSERLFGENTNEDDKSVAIGRVTSFVRELGLDSSSFESCLQSPEAERIIERDVQSAKGLEVAGTPGFAVGRIDSAKRVRLDTIIVGAQPFQVFEKAIKEELEKRP